MTGKYQKYKPEFRDEVARLVVESGRSIADVAREYGLNETTVGGWVKFAAIGDDKKEKYKMELLGKGVGAKSELGVTIK